MAQKKPDDAIATYRTAIEARPHDAGFYFQRIGHILLDQKKPAEAIAAFRKAVELAPTPKFAASAYFSLGIAFRGQDNLPEAIAAYRKAIELDPEYQAAGAYINLGVILWEQNKLDEAIAAFRKAIEVNQPYATAAAHNRIGHVLEQQNKLDEAIAAFRKAIELEANSPRSHNALAWILATRPEVNLREPKQAVALAKRAIELKPEEGSYRTTLGVAQYRAGDWKEAIAALEKAMAMRKGGDGNDWFFLAMAHWQLGEKDKAREWYDKAVEWMDKNQPKNGELRRFRAEAAELLGLKEKQ
jgi:superkiller protein 3